MQVITPAQDKTRAECRKMKFSGIRSDKILENFEIWLMGNMVEEITSEQLAVNPYAISRAYERAFGLHEGTVYISQ
jgi:hypothetical protein